MLMVRSMHGDMCTSCLFWNVATFQFNIGTIEVPNGMFWMSTWLNYRSSSAFLFFEVYLLDMWLFLNNFFKVEETHVSLHSCCIQLVTRATLSQHLCELNAKM